MRICDCKKGRRVKVMKVVRKIGGVAVPVDEVSQAEEYRGMTGCITSVCWRDAYPVDVMFKDNCVLGFKAVELEEV